MTRRRTDNEGIVVSGSSSVSIGTATVGRGARSDVTITPVAADKDMQEVGKRLRALEDAVAALAHRLPDPDSVRRGTRELAVEIAKPVPDRSKVTATLGQIAEAAKSVSGIVTAVEGLKTAIGLLF